MQCVVVGMAHGLDQHQAAEDGQPVSKVAMNPLYWVFHIWVDDATGIHVLALLVSGISIYITRLFMPIIFETLGPVFTTSLSLSVSFWPSPTETSHGDGRTKPKKMARQVFGCPDVPSARIAEGRAAYNILPLDQDMMWRWVLDLYWGLKNGVEVTYSVKHRTIKGTALEVFEPRLSSTTKDAVYL